MRIRGLGRLKTVLAKIRGQLAPGPMVLLYHRVAELPQDRHLLAVAPEHFEEHLLALRQHYRVVSLSELAQCLAVGSRPGPVVALTFDDGYADNAEAALPLLTKHGMPATFYLASGFVGSTREYFHDDLERLVLLPPQYPDELRITFGGKQFDWPIRSRNTRDENTASPARRNIISRLHGTRRHRAYREIFSLLRSSSHAEREKVFEQLHYQCGDPGPARPTHRGMSWDQARQMAACELIELGAHTVNHLYLSALPLKEQRAEILESKRVLEKQIGRPVTSFAYPYGTRDSYTAETVGLLKELGFTNACSNFRNRIGRLTDLFQIPRFVVRDWNGKQFLRKICKGRL
jgi:peptidoglycan/xylan/chitin deacetylase (PgdA/CDA1 family)